jgi:hypothetical protein
VPIMIVYEDVKLADETMVSNVGMICRGECGDYHFMHAKVAQSISNRCTCNFDEFL